MAAKKQNPFFQSLVSQFSRLQSCHNLEEARQICQNILENQLGQKPVRLTFKKINRTEITSEKKITKLSKKNTPMREWTIEDQLGLIKLKVLTQTPLPLKKQDRKNIDKMLDLFGSRLLFLAVADEIKMIQRQWKSTFEAVNQPLMVVSDEFEVLQSNLSLGPPDQRCYQLLFHRSSPCPNCPIKTRPLKANEEANEGESLKIFLGEDLRGVSELSEGDSGLSEGGIEGRILVISVIYTKEPKSFLHLYQDLSEEILFQHYLRDSQKKFELGLFTSSLAHELNNPLTGLMTLSQLLKSESPEPEVKLLATKIESLSRALLKPIQDILTFASEPFSQEDQRLSDLFTKLQALASLLGVDTEFSFQDFRLSKRNLSTQGMSLTDMILIEPQKSQILLLAMTHAIKTWFNYKKRFPERRDLPVFRIELKSLGHEEKEAFILNFNYFDMESTSKKAILPTARGLEGDLPEVDSPKIVKLCQRIFNLQNRDRVFFSEDEPEVEVSNIPGSKWARFRI